MNEFSPPTLKHLCTFIIVFGGGFGYIFWYEVTVKRCFSLNQLLDNAVSILILSAMMTAVLVEGTTMFYEAYEKRRKEEGKKEGKEEAFQISETNLAKILETRNLTKNDLPRLRRILSTGEDT